MESKQGENTLRQSRRKSTLYLYDALRRNKHIMRSLVR